MRLTAFHIIAVLFLVALLAPSGARADEGEWAWDVGIGPRIQFLSADRPMGSFSTKTIDWPSPYASLRYGLTDVGRAGALEVGVSGQYSAEADAAYGHVEWEAKKTGNVLENIESWNAGAEMRLKYGVELIPYWTLGVGWHRLTVYDIDFLAPNGARIAHYRSQLREVPYASTGAGLEWRFANYWGSSLDVALAYDIGEATNELAVPIRLKFTYYMHD